VPLVAMRHARALVAAPVVARPVLPAQARRPCFGRVASGVRRRDRRWLV